MPGGQNLGGGASAEADQALVASDQAASRLAPPSGFDPSRELVLRTAFRDLLIAAVALNGPIAVASKCCVAKSSVTRWLNGDSWPSAYALRPLIAALASSVEGEAR